MADSYWDPTGWRKESQHPTSFIPTTVQINNGSDEALGQIAITVDGAGGDATTEISTGDYIYASAKPDHNAEDGWFTPLEMGKVTNVAATEITVGDGILNTIADDYYIYKLNPHSGILRTPLKWTILYLDDVDDGTEFTSPRFDWLVDSDFSLVLNYEAFNRADLTMNGSTTVNDVEIVGSVNGTNWAVLKDFGELDADGKVCSKVYDIDAQGVLPYMAIRTTGPSADQGTHSDGGGVLGIKVAIVPHQ